MTFILIIVEAVVRITGWGGRLLLDLSRTMTPRLYISPQQPQGTIWKSRLSAFTPGHACGNQQGLSQGSAEDVVPVELQSTALLPEDAYMVSGARTARRGSQEPGTPFWSSTQRPSTWVLLSCLLKGTLARELDQEWSINGCSLGMPVVAGRGLNQSYCPHNSFFFSFLVKVGYTEEDLLSDNSLPK